MKQGTQLDFSGQKIFVGIDVHKKSWKVSLRSEHMELKVFSQDPSAFVLTNHLRQNYPLATYHVVYEAGFCGFHYQREFSAQGINCIVVNPADVPTTDKEKQRKTDTVDCRKLSRTLSEGGLKGIFVPGVEQQDDRDIIRTYSQMVKDQTRHKNRIRGWLSFHGVECTVDAGQYWSNNFVKWLKGLPLSPSSRIALDMKVQGYEQSRSMVLAAIKQVRLLSRQPRHKAAIELIRTVPGIGEVNALLFVTEIGDIRRFKNLDALCGFVGLVPNTHSTGEKDLTLGLTNRAHHQLREKLIEASWMAVKLDPALTMAFNNLCKRMKKNKAIIRVAKKLLNRIRYVMLKQTGYVMAVVK